MSTLSRKDLLGLEDLTPGEIGLILDTADSFKEISDRDIKKVPALRGKTVILFFSEPSTRTRTSFEIAGKRLSADTVSLVGSSSSLVKGETLVDTLRNLEAMNPDVVVIRHFCSGAPHALAGRIRQAVINAGDVIMMLRIQLERQAERLFPGVREYARVYGLNRERVSLAAPDAIVMHPGPLNRGVEISPEVADGPRSVILDQVTNGVAVRMVLLYLPAGRGKGA